MRYIADYSVGKWLLVNTADASAKWYTEKYILQLSKKHKINGVVNGAVMIADRDKISFYLSHMLKPSDYSFYLKPNCSYYISFDFRQNLWTLMEYDEQGGYLDNYRFVNCNGLAKTLSEYRLLNIVGSKYLQKDLQRYYIVKNSSLIFVDSYIKEQLQRAGITQSAVSVFAKANSLYIPLTSGFFVVNTKTNASRFVRNLPSDSMILY